MCFRKGFSFVDNGTFIGLIEHPLKFLSSDRQFGRSIDRPRAWLISEPLGEHGGRELPRAACCCVCVAPRERPRGYWTRGAWRRKRPRWTYEKHVGIRDDVARGSGRGREGQARHGRWHPTHTHTATRLSKAGHTIPSWVWFACYARMRATLSLKDARFGCFNRCRRRPFALLEAGLLLSSTGTAGPRRPLVMSAQPPPRT